MITSSGSFGGRRGADIYLIDRVKGRWDFNESCRQVVALQRVYPKASTILIEDAANGPAIISALSGLVSGIVAVTPEGGKLSRAQAVAPRVEAGNVHLPNPRPNGRLMPERQWVEDFLHQCSVFPTGAHDDDVDAFTQLLVRWAGPGGLNVGMPISVGQRARSPWCVGDEDPWRLWPKD
jgi:predicted phage terminase large subunit-like protein